jgi:DNA/RNA-binding domain of Phe-tRNA-synthetase-like protein
MQIQIELPEAVLGVVEADEVRFALVDERLAALVDRVCEGKRREFTVESLAEAEPTRAVRAMFRAWGVDPSKYRPSSEALLRRVIQGKGLYRVSNLVDVSNLGSIETGWPYGCYDRSRLTAPVVFRCGAPSESYQGIGKRTWHLEGRPVLADTQGPFGSPISDSTRSMIGESVRDVLVVIYAPSSASDASLEEAMASLAHRLSQFAAARTTRAAIGRKGHRAHPPGRCET